MIAGQQQPWFDYVINHPSIPFNFPWAIPCQYTYCYRGTGSFFLPLAGGSQNTFIKCKQPLGKKYVYPGLLQRKYDVQNRLSLKKRVDSHLNKHLQWVCSMWRASILLAFLAKFSMDKSTWSKTTSLSPRRLKPVSHYPICIEAALPYLLIHKIIQRSGVFDCRNYCKSSTDHTAQPQVSSSHDLLIPSASTGLQTARQPNCSATPTQNAVKETCSLLPHQ